LYSTVSVIIPVLNNCSQLKSVLWALNTQTYPADKIEVIVVDNGSDTDISECIGDSGVKLLFEKEIKSPYAARNKGIISSSGAILAFTDANKTPDPEWIEQGVKALIEQGADIAGGRIDFVLPDRPSAAQVYDSVFFNNNRNLVQNEQAAVTGNLFVKRELIESVGRFHGQFRSGMDVWWTQRSVRMGYKLVFAEKAVVYCEPRKYSSVMSKSRRVGISHPFIRAEAGDSIPTIAFTIFRTFAPPRFKWLSEKVPPGYSSGFLVKLWFTAWASKCWLAAGRFQGLLLLKRIRNNL
jgi:glycosyltransferase involved in cell wall biosynthesis